MQYEIEGLVLHMLLPPVKHWDLSSVVYCLLVPAGFREIYEDPAINGYPSGTLLLDAPVNSSQIDYALLMNMSYSSISLSLTDG
jgi:hypothetical protein